MLLRRITSVCVVLLFIFSSCKKEEAYQPNPSQSSPVNTTDTTQTPTPCFPPADDDNLFLGNPTNAERFVQFPNNYLLDHEYYIEGYSNERGTPLWVSWHLQSEDLGSTPRQNDFRIDYSLDPGVFYQVPPYAYSGSGFDRGHNCPSADRTSTVEANSSTFLMTNMSPQSPKLNQGPWAGLETYIRNTLVGSSREAFIVMGSYGEGGIGNLGTVTYTINNGNVTVPEKFFKIAIIIPKGDVDFSRLDTSATVLAVNMPNNNGLYSTASGGQSAWRSYRTTIANIESDAALRGIHYDLLRNITDTTLKNYLKQKFSVN